jgi:hypothetical protein
MDVANRSGKRQHRFGFYSEARAPIWKVVLAVEGEGAGEKQRWLEAMETEGQRLWATDEHHDSGRRESGGAE